MAREREAIGTMLVELFHDFLRMEHRTLDQGPYGDLTVSELHALDAIGSGGASSVSSVLRVLRVTSGTLSTTLGRLEHKGYIVRAKSSGDKRVVSVAVTEKGRAAFEAHRDFQRSLLSEDEAELSEGELTGLQATLAKLGAVFKRRAALSGGD